MPPGGDVRIDITDVYAFQKATDSSKSILIMNVNPLARANAFRPDAIYEIRVDNDGDAHADVAFKLKFSEFSRGNQTVTIKRAAGPQANGRDYIGDIIIENAPVSFTGTASVTESGAYKFFAGIRSDPFFFDLLGFLDQLHFTGSDFFADKNVFGTALELPNTALGSNPDVGVWARTLIPQDGGMLQVDRMGRPAINTVFMHGKEKAMFNRAEPHTDVARFTRTLVEVLEAFGHSQSSAENLAGILLPDILTYNYNNPGGFLNGLNGRKLTDDVIDAELGLVSNGALTSDGAGVHTDLIPGFPYMGPPH